MHIRTRHAQVVEKDVRHVRVVMLPRVNEDLIDPTPKEFEDDRCHLHEVGSRRHNVQNPHPLPLPDLDVEPMSYATFRRSTTSLRWHDFSCPRRCELSRNRPPRELPNEPNVLLGTSLYTYCSLVGVNIKGAERTQFSDSVNFVA